MMLALLLTAVTGAKADVYPTSSADVGKVLCSDGTIYATVSEATAAGKTPEAMIAYVNEEKGTPGYGKALAISLADAPVTDKDNGCKHDEALALAEEFNTTHAVARGTWRLPTVQDWEHMLIGCGSTSSYVASLPNPSWSSTPYPDLSYEFHPGNMRAMMVAAGGTDFLVNINKYKGYWTNTKTSTTDGMWWDYYFDLGGSPDPLYGFSLEVQGHVRPCVEFYVGTPYNLSFQPGTVDAEHWTISPNPCLSDRSATLKYTGNKVVKSVKLLNAGTEAYCPYSTMLRRPQWIVSMPAHDDVVVVEYDESYNVLSYNEDNSVKIDELNGTTTDVVINTVLPQGWSVLSLPFDLPGGFKPNLGLSAKKFVGSSYTKGTGEDNPSQLKLYFEDVTDLEANTPYLVLAKIERDLFNFPFTNVTVSNVGGEVQSKYANFIATNSQTTIMDNRMRLRFVQGTYYVIKEPPYVIFEHPYPYIPNTSDPVLNGLSGYFWLSYNMPDAEQGVSCQIVFGPYESEPVEAVAEVTTETPGDIAKAGEVNTSESGITYSLPATFSSVDEHDGSITIMATMTTDAMKAIIEANAPGTAAFFQAFTGFYFMMAAGKGKVEIETEVLGEGAALAIMQGFNISDEYTMSKKGTFTIEYDVKEDTWFFAFPVVKALSEAPARSLRAPEDPQPAVKIYSIKVLPDDGGTVGIGHVSTEAAGNGHLYNLQGQRVTLPKKGLYVVDGRKFFK